MKAHPPPPVGPGHDLTAPTGRLLRAAAPAFPALLWLIGSFFFLGALGKYSDDWSLNLRDPATGTYVWPDSPFERWPYFWRPLHLVLTHTLGTLFWEHDWVCHALNAALHGLVAWRFHRLLRTLGVGRAAAAAAMLILLTHPVTYEAVLWPSTVSTLIAILLWIHACSRVARQAGLERPIGPRLVAVLGVTTFVAACFYEQQAGCMTALPLLYLACAASKGSCWSGKTLRRSVLIGIGPAIACALYIVLMLATAPAHVRGGAASFDSPGRIAGQFVAAAGRCVAWIGGDRLLDGVRGGLTQARVVLFGGEVLPPVLGAGILAGLVLAATAWSWWSLRLTLRLDQATRSASGAASHAGHIRSPAGVALFVLVCIGLALAPTAVLGLVGPQPRLIYFPLLCALMAVAVAASALAHRARMASSTCSRLLLPLTAVASIVGALTLLGYQDQLRRRSVADMDQLSQLRQLVPLPPPGTTFVPLELAHRATQTGVYRFDQAMPGAASLPWACWAWIGVGYERRDLRATNTRPGTAPTITQPSAQGFQYRSRWGGVPARVPGGGWFVDWSVAVPFIVERDNTVRLVRRLRIVDRASGAQTEHVVDLPVVSRYAATNIAADRFIDHTLHAPRP